MARLVHHRSKRTLTVLLSLTLFACSKSPPASPPVSDGAPTTTAPATTASVAPASKEDFAPEAATGYRARQAVRGERQLAAAAHPAATRAGIEILRAGGSAVDAAIAMAVTLTLVEPQSSGIGGGAFMLRFDGASAEIAAYDGRETAPQAATPDMFLVDGKPRGFRDAVVGGLSVGVPGELRMLELAHKRHGKLPWQRLFQPAIRLAEEGFELSPRLYSLLKLMPELPRAPGAGGYFYGEDGQPKPVGTKLVNRELAEVLRAVAERGADAFYGGPIATDIAEAVRKAFRHPGRMTVQDIAAYRPVVREAVCGKYRSYDVCGMPPPSSGGTTVLSILGMLASFELSALPSGGTAETHLFAEASRLAYADRDRYVADPDHVRVPTAELIDPGYLARRAQRIDRDRAARATVPPGVIDPKGAYLWGDDRSGDLPSTSHMVAVDASGNVVTMTASIESAFGSHVWVRGFLLNNELTDFSFLPREGGRPVANRVEPGKRPRSSMAPTLVLEGGKLFLAVGSPGGSRIIEYVARVLVAVLDHGEDVQTAISRPNVSNRNGPTELEPVTGREAWLAETKAALESKGHEVVVRDLNSGLQAVQRVEGGWLGGADPRREGLVLAD